MIRAAAGRVAARLSRIVGPLVPPLRPGVATTIAEITPCNARVDGREGVRLNLVLPSISTAHYFGGIHTAVMIYRSLCKHFPLSRIILLDAVPEAEALGRFDDHQLVPSDSESDAPRQIVSFSDRYSRTLPVRAGDCWLGTAWWTAYAAQRMAAWQEIHFGMEMPLAYLIQDFEPGFYPFSSRSALALSTYRPTRDIAIFNTGLLAEHFRHSEIGFETCVAFEPTINQGLRPALEQARQESGTRARRIVVYARPSTPRNAFELLCEGLNAWGWSDPLSTGWEVVAPGELTEDVKLGSVTLRALGKLDIAEYGTLLRTSAVGVSLMISPHPSYPPLEMAAFGMGVITNRYQGKDLALWSGGIRSIGAPTPESLASELAAECARWIGRGMQSYPVIETHHQFLGAYDFDGLAGEVAGLLMSRTVRS